MCGAHCVVAMQHRGNQQPGTNFYITYLIASPSPSCLPQESQVLPRGHGNKEPHQLRELQAEPSQGTESGRTAKKEKPLKRKSTKKELVILAIIQTLVPGQTRLGWLGGG